MSKMMGQIRYDFFKVNVPAFKVDDPKKDSNGFLRVDSTPTRAGVFMYRDSIGNEWGELRHPDDVFSVETMDSLKGLPYTTQSNHVELFTPENAANKTFGMSMEDVSRVENHARVPLKIVDGKEIKAIEGEKDLELSAGYRCDVINESGIFEGVEFQKRQKNIRYNHIARVKNARGGETCRIRLDSNSAINGIEAERIDSEEISENHKEESIMEIIQRELPEVVVGDFRLDAEEVELPKEYKGVITQLKKREKRFTTALKEAVEKFDSLTNEAVASKAKFDILEAKNTELEGANVDSIPKEKLDEFVKERSGYLNTASEYKLDGADKMTNEEIIVGVVKKAGKLPESKHADLENPVYAKAAFDMLDHKHEKKKIAAKENLDNHSFEPGKEGETSAFDKARAWRNG
jgi:hypothetical protein